MPDFNFSLKIEQYVGRKVDFDDECSLWQKPDGSIAIATWNIDSHPEPTIEQLAAYEDAAVAQVERNIVLATRKAAYPPIGDQLDMQYWDAKNGTTIWEDLIDTIKSENPI
ncbi:MAG: hypothetical protein CME71_11645 [Halobacteriovorax sp.]|nr:hypothetical protein [Halobacteriovorax sp.]|tara:strand:- start:477 stop:809 length:333 start_codon:yes stop_codon:yes gene_type:complete